MGTTMQPTAALIETEHYSNDYSWAARAVACARNGILRGLGLLLLTVAPITQAQVLDDIDVQKSDDGVAVLVKFAAQVSYRRHVVSPTGDEVQIYFVLTAVDASGQSVTEDIRNVPASLGLPAITVHYLSGRQTGALRRVDLRFAEPVSVSRVGLGTDNRSLVAIVQKRGLGTAPTTTYTAPAPTGSGDPTAMLDNARKAISAGKYEEAVALLNQILNLPPNAASPDAQELIGNAREGLGENDRARAEYELYLKLFPDLPGAQRVKDRIAAMGIARDKGGKGETAPETIYWGSVSQSYYGGQSRIRNETTIITPGTDATQIDIQDISSNDQSSIVTNLDANARYRGNGWDDRFVVRDVSVWSLLNGQPSQNRLSAAYADFKNEGMRFDARAGRQSSMSGAVLGRFDGAQAHYGIGPSWRIGAFAGTPAEATLGARKTFYGLTVDNDKLLDGLGLGMYAVEQRTEGLVDRRALGSEIRYFSQRLSIFSLLDYDIHFNRVNVASGQGSLTLSGGAILNALYDYRRSPPLQLTNVLLGSTSPTLQQLLETQTRAQLEREALGLTPISKVLLLGGLVPVSPKWQMGAEFRVSSVSDTVATATLPAAPGTGNVYSYTLQAIGSGIFTPSTVVVFNGNRLTSDAFDAWLVSVNTRFRPTERWSVEPTLRYYIQDNKPTAVLANAPRLKRLSPTLRTTYQLSEKVSLEGEISAERSQTNSLLVNENSNVLFYYFGYRAEF